MVRMHQQLGTPIGIQGAYLGALSLMKKKESMFRGTWIGWMKTFPEFLVKNLVLSSMRAAQSGGELSGGQITLGSALSRGNLSSSLSLKDGGITYSALEPTLTGMLPRVLASTISARLMTYPFEVCKLRVMQYEGPKPYSGLWDTGRRIVIEEGITGLFKGLSMGLCANVVYSLTMSLVSPWTHSLASQLGANSPELSLHVARLISTFTSYPFETIKRRLASNCAWVPLTSLPSSSPHLISPLLLFKHIIYTDWTQLWAGFPILAFSLLFKSLLVRSSHHFFNRFFMWNNGYTVSIFDSTPLPGIPQYLQPDDLLRRKRYDARV